MENAWRRPKVSLYERKRLATLVLRDKIHSGVVGLFDQLIKEAEDLHEAASQLVGEEALKSKRQAGNKLLRARRLATSKLRPVYKTCTKCHKRRRQRSFYRACAGSNELRAVCKKCMSAVRAAWRKAHPDRDASCKRQSNIKKQVKARFGLTLEQFEQLSASSDGLCQICRQPERRQRRLSLDHDHVTGRLRGFLCCRCNMLLGYADENTALLERAAAYLRTADLGVPVSKGGAQQLVEQPDVSLESSIH